MQALGIDVLFKGTNLLRLLQGLWIAVQISGISVVLSLVLGVLVGIFMMWKNPVARAVSRLYLEIVRIMPQLALLYIVFFGATRVLGINLTAEFSAIIVFTFWGTGEMGDLVRGALASTPRHQYESAAALGFTRAQAYLERQGFEFDPASASVKDGQLKAIYLKDEIAGFAIHLVQK